MSLTSDGEGAKAFVAALEKALKQFEHSTGWADLIPILGKVKKTLETYAQFRVIPKRLTLCKRLAQCLHPALPSGVHLATLEVCETIFPLPVKPVLLMLYEKYFVPLDEALNPVLSGFLIGLFSALEDGADYYDRVVRLLESVADRIDEVFFYTCVWSAIQRVATVRFSAVTFILNHFDRRKILEDQMYLIGLSVETMVSAVCASLHDNEQPLVQRIALDFLLACLPLHRNPLTKENTIKIMTMMLHVLLKRDAALNRRVYTWFLGTNKEPSSSDATSYFASYTQELLINSLRHLLQTVSTKAIRVLLVLVEKPDVGPDIIEFIFMHYLLAIYEQAYRPAKTIPAIDSRQESEYADTFKTFHMLLDTLEPYFIWTLLTKTFDTVLCHRTDSQGIAAEATVEQICGIILMLLEMTTADASSADQVEHLAELLYHALETVNAAIETLTPDQAVLCVDVLSAILKAATPVDYQPAEHSDPLQDDDIEDHSVDDMDEIQQLLNQMVRKVEKQLYNLDHSSANVKRTRLSTRTKMQFANQIENITELYKIFFHRFVTVRLVKKSNVSLSERFHGAYTLLQHKTNEYQKLSQFQLSLSDDADQYRTAFDNCCKLLNELCCFPLSSTNSAQASAWTSACFPLLVELRRFSSLSTSAQPGFEDWLTDLCMLSACRSDRLFFQTKAVSVLINILAHSPLQNSASEQISSLLNSTTFFHCIVSYLWDYLSDRHSHENSSQASHTLSMLHSVLPFEVCEAFISDQLALEKIGNEQQVFEKYKRFFKLWNASRQMLNRTGDQQTKSFQHCLVQVLSILNGSSQSCLKSAVQQWVRDCFAHGDMSRIFDILLIMLLQPDTARTDADSHRFGLVDNDEMHFSFAHEAEQRDHKDSIDDEADYDETDEEKRIRAISCMQPGESMYPVRSSSLTTRFPSLSSLSQPILSNIRSLSPPILLKAAKARTPTTSPASTDNNMLNSSLSSFMHAHSVPTERILNEESLPQPDDVLDSSTTFILYYTQGFDYERVTLSLNIISSLIEIIPEQLVHSLLTTSGIQSTPPNLHNKEMQALYSTQLRQIEREGFDLSVEEHRSYLCLLLNTLLIFTYSYRGTPHDIEENHRIHLLCLTTLTRLCRNLTSICVGNSIFASYVASLMKKVSFQKILLCLFNRTVDQRTNVATNTPPEQVITQYLKQLVQLIEEIAVLENTIVSTDSSLIPRSMITQKAFLSTILQYLKQIRWVDNHRYILSLVTKMLPYCESALKTVSAQLVEQICRNACFTASHHGQADVETTFKDTPSFDALGYIVQLIKNLTHICNYCLGTGTHYTPNFTSTWTKRPSADGVDQSDARQALLRKFPLILSALVFIWKTVSAQQRDFVWMENHVKNIRQVIVELVTALVTASGTSLIRAVAQCWKGRKQQPPPDNTGEKNALIQILTSINNFKIHDIIYCMNELFVRLQTTTNAQKRQQTSQTCLQFLLAYVENHKNLPKDYWPALATMLKECLAQPFSAPVIFSMLRILGFLAQSLPVFVEKRDSKDFQEIAMRVLEGCNTIVAGSLKQTTWRRKNFQVRLTQSESENGTLSTSETDNDLPTLDFTDVSQPSRSSQNALSLLADYAAKLLDAVYQCSDDKDRVVVAYLQTLIPNIMPFVRTHVSSNASSYRAASTLLMRISQYPYTRKAWKKEVFEQLFDAAFFQVDIAALRSWKVLIDNVISQSKSTLRDVISRISTVPTGLFGSKEQEYEQRAILVKRFAFVIFASSKDQYNRDLPEILAFITDLLKIPTVPVLYAQVFLLLRVLVIRVSSKNLVSFWPIIMSELIQVFLQIEQDLSAVTDTDTRPSSPQLTITDVTLLNTTANPQAVLKLYLYACKLLDVLLAVPYSELYHFQLFRSAFVLDYGLHQPSPSVDAFTTFSVRLSNLFDQKLQPPPIVNVSNRPFLRLPTILNINDLGPFFHYLSSIHLDDDSGMKVDQHLVINRVNTIELSVLEDFVESWH